MKTLTWTAVTALVVGALTAIITGVTWPKWDAAEEYLRAVKAANYAGADAPSSLAYALPPADFAAGHEVALMAAAAVFTVGVLAGLLALHARAVSGGIARAMAISSSAS